MKNVSVYVEACDLKKEYAEHSDRIFWFMSEMWKNWEDVEIMKDMVHSIRRDFMSNHLIPWLLELWFFDDYEPKAWTKQSQDESSSSEGKLFGDVSVVDSRG